MPFIVQAGRFGRHPHSRVTRKVGPWAFFRLHGRARFWEWPQSPSASWSNGLQYGSIIRFLVARGSGGGSVARVLSRMARVSAGSITSS